MADVKTCDTCGRIITDKAQTLYEEKSNGGTISIKLDDKDWCSKCAGKTFAKISMNAWEDNKTTKQEKLDKKFLMAK